jgi:hypothetical protein
MKIDLTNQLSVKVQMKKIEAASIHSLPYPATIFAVRWSLFVRCTPAGRAGSRCSYVYD